MVFLDWFVLLGLIFHFLSFAVNYYYQLIKLPMLMIK